MTTTVCLCPTATLEPTSGGGHLWVYLNWALGLQAVDCTVIWLEAVPPNLSADDLSERIATLKRYLRPYGLDHSVAVYSPEGAQLPKGAVADCLDLDAAVCADLLLNQRYATPEHVVKLFRRSVLVDIDPGLLQVWMSAGQLQVAPHDLYITTGETVGQPEALFPSCGLFWHYVPPPVSLQAWPFAEAPAEAAYTTVSNWWGDEWLSYDGEVFENNKRVTFLQYAPLPHLTSARLELALCLGPGDAQDRACLETNGWAVRPAETVSATPERYQAYIQASRGEFSCAKPSCMRLANAWISDRTLCYLASGRPAIVQHTGKSRFLPDADGLLRFRSLSEAAEMIDRAEADYERHCRSARALVEHYFDASKVVAQVLERALA